MTSWVPQSLLDGSDARQFLAGADSMVEDIKRRASEGVASLNDAFSGLTSAMSGQPAAPAAPTLAPPEPAPAPPSIAPELPGASMPRNVTDTAPFTLPSFEDFSSSFGAATGAVSEAASTAAGAARSLLPQPAPSAEPAARQPALTTGPAAPAPTAGAPPQRGGDLREYARGVAAQYGLDPGIFERQIQQESNFNPRAVSPAGASGIAQFMPGTARAMGLADPFEPYAALDAAARHMRDNLDANAGDYARALAAYNAGQGNVNKYGGVPPFAETRNYIATILGDQRPTATPRPAPPAAPAARQPALTTGPIPAAPSPAQPEAAPAPSPSFAPGELTPHQYNAAKAAGLDDETAWAVCGPAAAIAFARRLGRNPTMPEALDLAKQVGWTAAAGMAGPASQQRLLSGMGIAASLEDGAPDAARVARDVSAGNPVIVSTPGHYFVAERYDPNTGRFDFGQSAQILRRSGGQRWFTLGEVAGLGMGAPRAALYLDNPASPSPSPTAGRAAETPVQPAVAGQPSFAPEDPSSAVIAPPGQPSLAGAVQDVRTEPGASETGIGNGFAALSAAFSTLPTQIGQAASGALTGAGETISSYLPSFGAGAAPEPAGDGYRAASWLRPEQDPSVVEAEQAAAARRGAILPTLGEAASAGISQALRPVGLPEGVEPQTEAEARALVEPGPGGLPTLAQARGLLNPAQQWQSYQRAQEETADVLGRRVGGGLGLSDVKQPVTTPVGTFEISQQDVAGMVAQLGLDPLNLVGPGPTVRGARAVVEGAMPAVREGAEAAGRAIGRALPAAPEPGLAAALPTELGSGLVFSPAEAEMRGVTRARVVEQPPLYPTGTPEASVDALLRQSAPPASGRLAQASGADLASLPQSPFSPNRKLETAVPGVTNSGKAPIPVNPGGLPAVDDVRAAVDVSLAHKDWYYQIAERAARLVGEPNLPEFFTIFGITSAQTKVHDNIAATVQVMRSVRELVASGATWATIKAAILDMGDQVQSTYKTGPNAGQGRFDNKGKPVMEYTRRPQIPFVLGSNDKRQSIVDAYETAISRVESGAKTSSYSGSFESAGQRVYDPRTTNDMWVWRGFNITPAGERAAANDDDAYRVVEAVLNELAAEKGLPGHNVQAALWATMKNLWEQAPDLAQDYASGAKSLRQVVDEGSRRVVTVDGRPHRLFDVPTGQAQDFDRPEVQRVLAGANPGLLRAPGPEQAAQMTRQYSGQAARPGVPQRPSNLPFRLQERAVAEGRAPTAAIRLTPGELEVVGLDRERGIFPWLTIPHRVAESGGTAVVHLPGGTSESAQYVGAVIGDALGRPVTVSAPKHGAATLAGVTVRAAPEQVAALVEQLRAAGVPHAVGTTGGVVQIPHLGGAAEPFLGTIQGVARQAGIAPSSLAPYTGDVTHAAAGEHRGAVQALGPGYGSQRPPDLSGGAGGGGGPARAAPGAGAAPGAAPELGDAPLGAGLAPSLAPGLRASAFNAAQGGFVGGASEVLMPSGEEGPDPAEMARRGLIGAGLGFVAGNRAARQAATRGAQRLGSGVVAEPGPGVPRRLPSGLPEGAQPIRLTREQEIERLGLERFPAELRPHLLEAAEAEEFGRAARRGVIPDAVSEQMADDINRSVDSWISKGKPGQALNAEQTRALRNVFTGQAQKVDQLAREIEESEAAGTVTDLLITRHYVEAEKLAALVPVVEGARAEAGRGLRAWAAETRPTDPVEAAGRIFQKFGGGPEGRARALEAVKLFNQIPRDDPIAGAKFWAQIEKGGTITAADVLTAIRYNSMLSSPRTWEIGWVGSILQAPLKIASDVMAAATRPTSGELGEAAKGAALGIRAGLRPLWETIWHGVTTEQALAGQLPRGLGARATTPLGRAVGTAIDLPGRMVAAPDAFFTSLFTQAEKGRVAAIEAYQQGLAGADRDAFISAFMQDTPKAAQAQVDRVVDSLMLRGEMGRIGRWASGVATKDPLIGSFVAPFMKVSYHIWSQGVELTPVGAIGTAVDVARGAYRGGARPEGVRPLAERARYNAIGLGITGAATWQALHGNVSGIGPDDPQKRDQLRATGWQPYSVRIGGSWVSYANWGPVAVPFALAAAYAENQQYKKPGATNEEQMFDMVARVGKLATEQTFLSGIGTIMNAFEDPQRYLPQLLTQQVASTIPYGSFLNTVAASQDEYQRRADRPSDVGVAESLRQSLLTRIPMNPLTPDRGDVPIAQGPLGRPLLNIQQGAMAAQPFRISPEREDRQAQIAQTYLDVGVDLGRPPSSFTEEGVKIEMTPEEQRSYQRYMGDEIDKSFDRAANASDRRRTDLLQSLYEDARTKALNRVKADMGRSEIRQRVRSGAAR